MRESLADVVELFELAQAAVFKLMASVSHPPCAHRGQLCLDLFQDSVPKFLRDPRHASVLREHDVDLIGGTRALSPATERLSRSNTGRG